MSVYYLLRRNWANDVLLARKKGAEETLTKAHDALTDSAESTMELVQTIVAAFNESKGLPASSDRFDTITFPVEGVGRIYISGRLTKQKGKIDSISAPRELLTIELNPVGEDASVVKNETIKLQIQLEPLFADPLDLSRPMQTVERYEIANVAYEDQDGEGASVRVVEWEPGAQGDRYPEDAIMPFDAEEYEKIERRIFKKYPDLEGVPETMELVKIHMDLIDAEMSKNLRGSVKSMNDILVEAAIAAEALPKNPEF